MKIAVFVGSLRRDSFNRRLARAVEKLAPAGFEFQHIRIDDLPLYSQDFDTDYPPNAQRLKQEVEAADALLFVTPEYNRSIPGVLKNAIDHASRPWGKSVWAGKPAGVIGVSVGAIGTAMAQQHLRNVLAYLDMPTMPGHEAFIQWKEGLVENGEIGPNSKAFIQGFVDAFVAWAKKAA